HDAQPGGLLRPPNRFDTSRKIAVSAARPTSQPARKARPVGRGRGVCSTSTAGMMDSGESATTNASGMSSVSTRSIVPETPTPAYTERPAWYRQAFQSAPSRKKSMSSVLASPRLAATNRTLATASSPVTSTELTVICVGPSDLLLSYHPAL